MIPKIGYCPRYVAHGLTDIHCLRVCYPEKSVSLLPIPMGFA
jgi:hypothetical protein